MTCYGCIVNSRDLSPDDERMQDTLPVVEVGSGAANGWDYAPEYSLTPYKDDLILVCPKCVKELREQELIRQARIEIADGVLSDNKSDHFSADWAKDVFFLYGDGSQVLGYVGGDAE